ncbi:hypothetical protein [Streptomyces sp. NBC_01264]|uniref:hypothetical protein n=1 Tax=Streptomyces sp. NBC_01264 TaxID=2903804 RepID=UPI002256F8C6|nr:hypothetical protein [Streptomyces sp. NBC_01264]MCX4776890.1 hypothetical protein [Streptomyces sp. NBC_01264]
MALSPTELHRLRLQQLAVYVRDSRAHLQTARDDPGDGTEEPSIASTAAHAATWRAFRKISYSTAQLVTVAEIQATRLPADVLPDSWAAVCAGLRDAARRLDELQSQWLVDREEILARDTDTRTEYEATLQRRNHAAWPYLSLWSRDAETILQIDVLARSLTAPVARIPGLPPLPRRRAAPPNRP